jgi:hypothetical protein
VVAESPDQRLRAHRTARIFEIADLTGQIAGVHMAKAIAAPDGGRIHHHSGGCVFRIGHLVIAVKRGDVPGDLRRDASDETGQAFELVA